MIRPSLAPGHLCRVLGLFALLVVHPVLAAEPARATADKPAAQSPRDRYLSQAEIKRGLEHLQTGRTKDSKGDYESALKCFERAAELSSPEGQFHLGRIYANGWGVTKNTDRALQYYRQSADAKFPAAMGELGAAYLNGTGLAKDESEAAKWSRKAADLGDAPSQKRLGVMLRDGVGVKQDKREALTYFLKAGTAGDNDAGWIAARMYMDGDGVRADQERAVNWFSKLAERGHAESQVQLVAIDADLYRKVAKNVPGSELENNPKYLGFPVRLEGRVIAKGKKTWRLETPLAGATRTTFTIDPSQLGASTVRVGMAVRVYGMPVDGSTIRALVADLVPPEFAWKYALVKPKGVVGGKAQTYTVQGSITNTGDQPIKRLDAKVRMYQVSSPNDESLPVVIRDLAPGETKEFTATFTFYNFQFIGATSTPKVKFEVTDYDF